MFDLNAIVSAALNAAIQAATEPLITRIATLESVCATQHEAMVAMRDRIAALENNPAQGVDMQTLTALDNQEWFWEKLVRKAGEAAEAAVEAGLEEHTSTYDHDEYDSHIGDDDKHFDGDIEDAVRDALSNMSFDISIR